MDEFNKNFLFMASVACGVIVFLVMFFIFVVKVFW